MADSRGNPESLKIEPMTGLLERMLETLDQITGCLKGFGAEENLSKRWMSELRCFRGFATPEMMVRIIKSDPRVSGEFFSCAYSLFATPVSRVCLRPPHLLSFIRQYIRSHDIEDSEPKVREFDEYCEIALAQWRTIEEALNVTASEIKEGKEGFVVLQIRGTFRKEDEDSTEQASTANETHSSCTWTLHFPTHIYLRDFAKEGSVSCVWSHHISQSPSV